MVLGMTPTVSKVVVSFHSEVEKDWFFNRWKVDLYLSYLRFNTNV